MNENPVLTVGTDTGRDVKTPTLTRVGEAGAPSYPQVGGAALPSQPDVLRDLKGTVEATVATIKAAAQAGHKEAVLLAVQEINDADPGMVRRCPECGTAFSPRRSDQTYCTYRCSGRRRMRLLNQRRRAAVDDVMTT